MSRDVALTKRCGNAPKKLAILKELRIYLKPKMKKV